MHHCSDNCLVPFTVFSEVACKCGQLPIVGACNGAQHAAIVAGEPDRYVFGSPVSIVQGGADGEPGTIMF